MIKITIDHDNNEITVINTDFKLDNKVVFFTHTIQQYQEFIMEMFELMDLSETTIEKIDEGRSYMLGEW